MDPGYDLVTQSKRRKRYRPYGQLYDYHGHFAVPSLAEFAMQRRVHKIVGSAFAVALIVLFVVILSAL